MHARALRQRRHRQALQIDLDQKSARTVEHPQQALAVAQRVGVELRVLAQRLDAVAVANQRAHALDPAHQGIVVAPGDLTRQ